MQWIKASDLPKKTCVCAIEMIHENDFPGDTSFDICEFIPGYPWPVSEGWTVLRWIDLRGESTPEVKGGFTLDEVKKKLTDLSNDLYDKLPTGEVNAWQLIEFTNAMFKSLDEIIDSISNPPKEQDNHSQEVKSNNNEVGN